jgi:hypothetical protein
MTSNCPHTYVCVCVYAYVCVCVCVRPYDYHKQRLDNSLLYEMTLSQVSPDSIVPMECPALETSLCAYAYNCQ